MDVQQRTKWLSKIDGFFAGLLYIDKLTDDESMGDQISKNPDWSSIQQIRLGIERQWRHFVQTAPSLNLSGIDPILSSYTSSASFLEAGIFAFRRTLTGPTPTSLDKIFALCSLSYVISCFLQEKGKLPKCDVLVDASLWRNALQNSTERRAFSEIASTCWPETQDCVSTLETVTRNTDNIPCSQDSIAEFIITPGSQQWIAPGHLTESTMMEDCSFLDDVWLTTEFIEFLARSTQQAAFLQHTNHVEQSNVDALQNTKVISNMLHFLYECGDLMHVLSGEGMTAKDLCSCLTFTQERSETKNRIQCSYIRPLEGEQPLQNASSAAILSITDRFVDLGYLQSIDEVKTYLLTVGKIILPVGAAYFEFCQSILNFPFAVAWSASSSLRRLQVANPGEKETENSRVSNLRKRI